MATLIEQTAAWTNERSYLKDIGGLYMPIYELFSTYDLPPLKMVDWSVDKELLEDGQPLLTNNEAAFITVQDIKPVFTSVVDSYMSYSGNEAFVSMLDSVSELLKVHDDPDKLIWQAVYGGGEFEKSLYEFDDDTYGLLRFLVWGAFRVIYEPYKGQFQEFINNLKWGRPYCPLCGGLAVTADLSNTQGHGKLRYLNCGCCETSWRYRRIGCPYCENEKQSLLKVLEFEGELLFRADLCDNCNSYIKTYTGGREHGDIPLKDWASVHIDLLCGSRGYEKRGGLLSVE